MKILIVAYPLFPVHAGSAGGAEQILYLLDRGLMERGVDSMVVAAEGSCVHGRLFATPSASANIHDAERQHAQAIHAQIVVDILAAHSPDLIHFHGLDFGSYIPPARLPMLATLHLPLPWYSDDSWNNVNIDFVCVSHSQAASASGVKIHAVVPNGIDISQLPERKGSDSLLWLGRVCPEKGVHIALEVAKRVDLPIIIAGPVHPFEYHQTYFRTQVEPLLDDKRVYIGPVNFKQKNELLTTARALLVPSLAAETSSLVAMEAANAGTPVIAFASGALPEIVVDGTTGFIVKDAKGMAAAILRVAEISSSVCRHHASKHFSSGRMVSDYLNVYHQLIEAGS